MQPYTVVIFKTAGRSLSRRGEGLLLLRLYYGLLQAGSASGLVVPRVGGILHTHIEMQARVG